MRFYSVRFSAGQAITAACDLFEVTAATDKPVYIWGWNVYQTTDLGDANEEVLALNLIRGVTAGSGGTSVTPVAMVDADDSAAGATCNRSVTTASTGGTVVLGPLGWNIRMAHEFWFPAEMVPKVAADEDPVVLQVSAPADSITVAGCLIFSEHK